MNKTIGIFVGPCCLFPTWDETDLNGENKGLGGSEVWVVKIADEFARRGHRVVVFAVPDNHHISNTGVEWVHYSTFQEMTRKQHFDYIISSRRVDELYEDIPCKNIYLMCHDIVIINCTGPNDTKLSMVKKICYQSDFQKKFLAERYQIPETKFLRTFEGIDMEDYADAENVSKENYMCLSQGLNRRGSDLIIDEILPAIRKEIPDFTIGICGYDDDFSDARYRQNGIKILGKVTRKELCEEQKKAKIWIYPDHGYDGKDSSSRINGETFSITTIENAIAGNACILGDWGCFHSTLEGYSGFIGGGGRISILQCPTVALQLSWTI